MSNNLVMSQKERDHLSVIKEVIKGHLSASEAGKLLELSRRHVFRLLRRYREGGDLGLIHRLRGKGSNRGYPKRLKSRVLELYWRPEFRDYGPTLFAEARTDEESFDHGSGLGGSWEGQGRHARACGRVLRCISSC